ncbi:hypothetical protein [Gemmobacter megaterium]|uniref:hypothetical protein n=1 Tax=Gemmobacter megaterium TaxID=1086013 RepID=UPI0013562C6C|nr:hypothetical protein [Gemmobacter megaterium]
MLLSPEWVTLAEGLFGGALGENMIRTITLGSCVSVQGLFVRALGDGRIAIRDGDKTFVGRPIQVPPQQVHI